MLLAQMAVGATIVLPCGLKAICELLDICEIFQLFKPVVNFLSDLE